MKVLFFLNDFPKLSETFILNQITGLMDNGHQITIIARKPSDDNKIHENIEKYHLLDKVLYYNQKKRCKIGRFLFFFKMLIMHYERKIFNREYKGKNINIKQLLKDHDLLYLLIMCSLHSTYPLSFTVIIAHFGRNGILAQKLIDIGLIRGKLFTFFHGYDMLCIMKDPDAYLHLFNSNCILLPISIYWKNKLIGLGANPERIIVHHMGVDTNQFSFYPTKKPTINSIINIISVARFVEKKGLKYGIEAVAKLINRGYSIRYIIVGGGPLESELKEEVRCFGLFNHIFFEGWKTQSEIVELMKQMDLVLLPSVKSSKGDMEGIPVMLMEAMSMGKIVISTKHSGIPELIDNGLNGFLVQERNAEEIATVFVNLLNYNDHDWQRIENNAREKIKESFNIRKLNEELIDLFSKL